MAWSWESALWTPPHSHGGTDPIPSHSLPSPDLKAALSKIAMNDEKKEFNSSYRGQYLMHFSE